MLYDDCKFVIITVIGRVKDIEFKTNGREILVPGWRDAYTKGQQEDNDADEKAVSEERTLSTFTRDESGVHVPALTERQTIPPRCYTEAVLLRVMKTVGKPVDDEELRAVLKGDGIGRPSLHVSIIETLFERHYTQRERKRIVATPLEIRLIDIIKKKPLTSCELTSIWEKKLHDIEHQEHNAVQFISEPKTQITAIVNDALRDNSHSQLGTSDTPSK